MIRKYAVHPGIVTSRTDGDRHYITFDQLSRLYRVNPKDCILWDRNRPDYRKWEDYKHLFPNSNGVYQ